MHFLLFSGRGKTRFVVDALVEAAGRGVNVSILLEGHKSGVSEKNRKTVRPMKKVGIKVGYCGEGFMLHSKLVLVDDDLVLVGSSNLTDCSLAFNHESNILMQSVRANEVLWEHFHRLWKNPGAQHNSSCLIEDGMTSVLTDGAFVKEALEAIGGARERLRVMSYLFALEPKKKESQVMLLVAALRSAAERGVDVEILLEKSEHAHHLNRRAAFARKYLKSCGISSVRFDKPETISHGKLIIADDNRVIIGSTNWYEKGLSSAHQVNVASSQPDAVKGFTDYFDDLFQKATVSGG